MKREIEGAEPQKTERGLLVGLAPGECPIADRKARYAVERMLTSAAQYLRYQLARYKQQRPALDLGDVDLQDHAVWWFTERLFAEIGGWGGWDDGEHEPPPPAGEGQVVLWNGLERMLRGSADGVRAELGSLSQAHPEVDMADPAIQDWIVLRITQRLFTETRGWLSWDPEA